MLTRKMVGWILDCVAAMLDPLLKRAGLLGATRAFYALYFPGKPLSYNMHDTAVKVKKDLPSCTHTMEMDGHQGCYIGLERHIAEASL